MKLSSLWPLCLPVVLAGCEHGIVIEGAVAIPPEVTAELSRERPALLRVVADVPKSSLGGLDLAILCGAEVDPAQVEFVFDDFGCAKQGLVTARLERVSVEEADKVTCGLLDGFTPIQTTETIAYAEAVVFPGKTGELGCSDGETEVRLELALP